MMDRAEAEKKGLFHVIGQEIDDRYMEGVKETGIKSGSHQTYGRQSEDCLYSPSWYRKSSGSPSVKGTWIYPGTGSAGAGTSGWCVPDGFLSESGRSNAFKLALDLAEKTDADLVLATDPDADRLGVYAKDSKTGSYMPFTGNMSGLLIAEYELSVRKELGHLPKDGALVTTIVSSNMAEAIGKAYDVDVIEVLTGFKYIGEQIKFFEQNHEHTFLFGYEESYGCLVGTHARDKDAVVAVMALCEALAIIKKKA